MTAKENLEKLCDEYMDRNISQIIIDLVEDIQEVLHKENRTKRDEAWALAYQANILIEVYNPALEKDIQYLKDLSMCLDQWGKDIEKENIELGIPRES